ncbi:MAG: phage tail length tape measure family protein [Variibacter sp.]
MNLETIRKVRVVGSSTGLKEVTSDLQKMATAQDGVSQSSERVGRATLSMEKRYESLRRRFDADYRAQQDFAKVSRDLARARQQGFGDEEYHNKLLDAAAQRYGVVGQSMVANSKHANDNALAVGKASRQWGQLSYQLNDSFVSLASGQSPMMVLIQQGSQLQGVFGATTLAGVFAFGAIAAAAAKAAQNAATLERRQVAFNNALRLSGGASGQSFESSEDIARRLGQFGTQSIGDIRAVEVELMRFRNISGDAFEATLRAAMNLSSSGFGDLRTSVVAIGKAIQDPIRGLEGLRDAGVRVSAAQEMMITDLYRVGKQAQVTAAILKLLEEQAGGATAKSADTLSGAWGRLGNALDGAGTTVGKEILEFTNLRGIVERTAEAWERFNRARRAGGSLPAAMAAGMGYGGTPAPAPKGPSLEEAMRQRGELQPKYNAADYGFVQGQEEYRQRVGLVVNALELERREAGLTEVQLRILHEQQKAGAEAHTAAGRAIDGYVRSIMAARELRQFIDNTRMMTESVKIEAQTIGMGQAAAAAFRLEQEALAQARIRGIAYGREATAMIHAEAEAYRQAAQAAADLKLRSDLVFERSQLGRTDTEANIASRLRSIYGDDLSSAAAQSAAAMMRVNEQLKQTRDLSMEFVSGFSSDLRNGLRNGEDFWDAFAKAGMNAINRLADRLMDIALQNLVLKAFGGLLGGWSGGVPLAGGAAIGQGGIGHAHTGGVIGETSFVSRYVHPAYFDDAPRYHTGLDMGPIGGLAHNERPIIAKVGERVVTPEQWNAATSGGPQITYAPVYNVAQGADPRAIMELAKAQQKDRAEFKSNVIAAVREARSRSIQL